MEIELELQPRDNLESTVYTLLAAKARGERVYVIYNGYELHSYNITMDSAYKEVFGLTKEEYDKRMEDTRKNYFKNEEEKIEAAKARYSEWVERGKTLIMPEMFDNWKRCVEVRIYDIYHGADVEVALKIMEAFDDGVSIDETKYMFKSQMHSGTFGYIVGNIITTFSLRGNEFAKAIAKESKRTRRR